MKPVISVPRILKIQADAVDRWHRSIEPFTKKEAERLVLVQHRFNFDLWHEEDEARRTDVSDAEIAKIKRAIDALNQKRNDAIEALDQFFIAELARLKVKPRTGARLNTETVGSVIDRLSVLSLRVYHMSEELLRPDAPPDHRTKCAERLKGINLQKKSLSLAFTELLDDIFAGKKILRSYRQFKMYNDPTLNPALYRKKAR